MLEKTGLIGIDRQSKRGAATVCGKQKWGARTYFIAWRAAYLCRMSRPFITPDRVW
jgi:hypothetical protein